MYCVCARVLLNGSVDPAQEEDPPPICVLSRWERVSQNMSSSKWASDRILMDTSDAMENIKGLNLK